MSTSSPLPTPRRPESRADHRPRRRQLRRRRGRWSVAAAGGLAVAAISAAALTVDEPAARPAPRLPVRAAVERVRPLPSPSPVGGRTLLGAAALPIEQPPPTASPADDHRLASELTSHEHAATVWDRLADCESGEWNADGEPIPGSRDWRYDHRFEGGLNFHPDTWEGYRGEAMPASAARATRSEEIRVARKVLDAQGWKAWPVCSRKLGLR